jgi:hypothetical protein
LRINNSIYEQAKKLMDASNVQCGGCHDWVDKKECMEFSSMWICDGCAKKMSDKVKEMLGE